MRKLKTMIPVVKKMSLMLFLLVFLLPLPARSEIKAGSVEVTPFGGISFFEKQQNLEDSPLVGARLGYNFTNRLGIEGTWQFTRSYVDDKSVRFTRQGQFTSPANDINITNFNLGLVYHFIPESRFNPYLVAGYGVNHYSPKINNKNMSVIDFGAGLKFWLTEHIALRLDARDNLILDETINNVDTTLGVVIAFGGKSVAAKPIDTDGDGVLDKNDKCPGTPAGVAVDSDGCPRDSDKDGVPDYLDKCPGTPAGVVVDKDGCPLDSDKDGVPDYLDKCPGTPAGVKVDKDGCPPAVVVVPEVVVVPVIIAAPAAVIVPAHVKEAAAKRFCNKPVVLEIHFDFNKSDIKREYHAELKTVGEFLSYFPDSKGEISGHTDSIASYGYNQKLSERRAESVERYINKNFGIDPGRISTKGYGETKPIASNMLEAGRAKNRRIEANFTCK
jgi:OOP family OmpA-OmpF porin